MKHLEYLKNTLEPYPRLTPSQWAEEHIILPPSVTNRPGKLRLAPWFKQIIDEMDNPLTEEVNCMSAAQVGKTLMEMCCMAYCLAVWDAPAMVVFPTESEAENLLRRRFQPVIKATPALTAVVQTGKDNKDTKEIFGLNCSVKAGWAGSASSLASVACKVILLDETAKYGDNIADEADAISLASARTATYRRQGAKIFCVSTPITDQDVFFRQYNKGLIHEWMVECPNCGKMSFPNWANIHWNKEKDLRDIGNEDVWYECEHCNHKLKEKEYRILIRSKGAWVVNDENMETKPKSSKSYHLSGLLSDAYSFEYLVKEFLKSKDNPNTYQHFTNSIMGNAWADRRVEIKESAISKLILSDLPPLTVPPETMKVIAGIDPNGQPGLEPDDNGKCLWFWITLLAVHPAGKFTVIYNGRQLGWSATEKILQQELYCPSTDSSYYVSQAYIDSGYETSTIYNLALKNTGLIAVDGMRYQQEPVKTVMTDAIVGPFGKKQHFGGVIPKCNVDTTFFKDRIWTLISNELIHFASELHPDTAAHISNEIKRPTNKQGSKFAYFPKFRGCRVESLDTLVYSLACSYAAGDWRYNSWQEWTMVNDTPGIATPSARQAPLPQPVPYQPPQSPYSYT